MNGSEFLVPPLRVLVVCPSGEIGGAERWLFRLLAETDRLSLTAAVLGDGPLTAEWRKRGVPVSTIPVGRGAVAIAKAGPSLHREIKAAEPELVLVNGVRAGVAAAPSAWAQGLPLVWVKHDHSFDGPLTCALARASGAIIAPSATVGRAGTGSEPVIVQPPRSGAVLWPQERARTELLSLIHASGGSVPHDAPVVVAVGSRIPLKGLTDAVSALAGAPRWHLAIIGEDGPAAPGHGDELMRAARSRGVDARVHLVGTVAEAAQLMPGADAVVQLTRPVGKGPGREGYGMTVLEAACASTPVICTPCPAADELTSAGAGPGLRVVPPGQPTKVAEQLRAWTNPKSRAVAGAAVAAASRQHPSSGMLADRLASALAACAGRAGAGVSTERGAPVSVVTPLFSEGPHVADLITEIGRHLRPCDELVAVDDASPDDTAEQVLDTAARQGVPVKLVRRETNGGVGAARNSGIRAARHDVLVFADAGTTPAEGWLDAFRAAAASSPAAGMMTGRYTVSRRDPWQAAVASACYPEAVATAQRPWRRAWHAMFGLQMEASAPAGRSMAISRAAWLAIGGFDERRRAAEDVDAGQAVAQAGLPCLLVGDAMVAWDQALTWRGTLAMYRHYGRGDAQADHHRALIRDLVRSVAYPSALLAMLPGRRASVRRAAVLAAALVYASLPMARAARERRPFLVVFLVPVALALKDLAKAWGAIETITRRGS